MGIIKRLFRNRDDRDEIRELEYKRVDLAEAFHNQVQTMPAGSDELSSIYAEFRNEMDIIDDEVGSIETLRAIDEAIRWRVPLPRKPDINGEDNENWWFSATGRYHLTAAGLSLLRREVYREWEMWSNPWLSLGALTISVVSLLVAVLRP